MAVRKAPPAEVLEDRELPAKETWDRSWNIRRRMLEARRRLRGTPLWQKFSLQRDFDAFSVHQLALGVENILSDLGVISSFETSSWQKQGNTTVVVGVYRVQNVDDGEVIDYATLGEAVDNGDKGVGKAISYARKNGMISALNLGIGIDNEASDEKAEPAVGPSMSGTVKTPPPPKPKQADVNYHKPMASPNPQDYARETGFAKRPSVSDYIHQAPTSGNPDAYTLRWENGPTKAVSADSFVQETSISLLNALSLEAFDAFIKINRAELNRFCEARPGDGETLQQVQVTKRNQLLRKGA